MTHDQIAAKVDRLQANLVELAAIPQSCLEEFAADSRNLYAALYLLQTSIQALIDVGSFVTVRLGLPAPGRARDLLTQLEDAGHLPAGSERRYGPMFGFRNRVVHLYERIDPRVVFAVLTEERGDLETLLGQLLALLED